MQGNLKKAEEYSKASLELRKTIDSPQNTAKSLNVLGNIYAQQGKVEKAEKTIKKSLELYKEINNPFDISNAFHSLGNLFFNLRKLELMVY